MPRPVDVVICGAGIAGVSAAYHLAVTHGLRSIVLVDERPPLSLTSDKSTECYRNWWPGPGDAMVGLMNRSIDWLERLANQSGNVFRLNRRGYLYLTADPERLPLFAQAALEPPTLGAGSLRIHRGEPGDPLYSPSPSEGWRNAPDGADLLLDPALIQRHFPYLSKQVVAALHVRRAGWISAQQLGMYLLETARAHGVRVINRRVTAVKLKNGRVNSVRLDNGSSISTHAFVNAAGPFIQQVAALLGLELPVYCELHLKVAVRDPLGAVPRNAPMLIWTDPQVLPWSDEERNFLAEDPATQWLTALMPSGAHTRPEGGADSDIALFLWEYHTAKVPPRFPPPLDEQYPEIALRGLAAMLPALRGYFQKAPRPILDGGYYTKTRENRPLIGPLPVPGAYLIGAMSGYGLMSACAAGELLAAHVTGATLPLYASAFSLERYSDPRYLKLLENWSGSGQL
ncbi:MAG: FAD-binding oxidoreductase [Chloroflexi bacterium]|nr:FAD-binding oxidoreductase [Chloroflexota bacterium]